MGNLDIAGKDIELILRDGKNPYRGLMLQADKGDSRCEKHGLLVPKICVMLFSESNRIRVLAWLRQVVASSNLQKRGGGAR